MVKFYEHPTYYGCVDATMENDERYSKWEKQFEERGFDDTATWNFDCTLIAFIRPRLKAVIEQRQAMFELDEETQQDYQKMLDGFNVDYKVFMSEEDTKKVDKAFKLLAKHYSNLWW